MKATLKPPFAPIADTHITLGGSKSESNRLLLLQALYPAITINNLSNSDDAEVMQKGLKIEKGVVDIHHAGTAMRFLTAYFASQENKEVVLTGSKRMTERPIKVLVDALRELGADITYENNEGYPPIKIKGKKLVQNKVSLPANISSQYISALLLVAPKLENGLELELIGEITSVPYIKMTLGLLTQIGVESSFNGNTIKAIGKTSNNWYKFKYNNQDAYVSGIHLKPKLVKDSYTVTATMLNVRSSNSLSGSIIGRLPNGSQIEIVKKHKYNWVEIDYQGQKGFVSDKFLKAN